MKVAQNLLRNPKIRKPDGSAYLAGPADSEWGQQSARAAKSAKYWTGYPTRRIGEADGSLGPELASYLSGKKRLPVSYRLRRRARVKAQPAVPLRARALARAKSKLGTKESPAGSNVVEFSLWYCGTRDRVGPWCAMFVTWTYDPIGSVSFKRGSFYSYVPYMVADARAGRNRLRTTQDPEPGDIVCYDWQGDGVYDHTGLFEKWISKTAGTFDAIEGNTAVGNDSNGGEVMRRRRDRGGRPVFIRAS